MNGPNPPEPADPEAGSPTARSEDEILRARRWGRGLLLGAFLPTCVAMLVIVIHPTSRGLAGEGWSLLVEQDPRGLSEWAGSFGWWSPVATLGLMVVQALAFPLPALIVTFTNGILFGAFWGGVWSIVSGTFAATVCFAIGRGLGEPVVVRFVSRRGLDSANRFMREHGVFAILIARLVPVVPFDPISYAAGVTRIRVWAFVVATLVGQIPSGMLYAYYGPKILEEPNVRNVLNLATGVIAIALVAWLVRRLIVRRASRP